MQSEVQRANDMFCVFCRYGFCLIFLYFLVHPFSFPSTLFLSTLSTRCRCFINILCLAFLLVDLLKLLRLKSMFFSNIWFDLVDSFIYNLYVILITFLDVFYYIYYVVIVHSLAHTVLVRIDEGTDVQSEVQRANDMFCVFCRPNKS